MIESVLEELVTEGCDDALCPDPARLRGAVEAIMRGDAQPSQISALLMGMRVRGEKPEHLRVVVESMLAHAVKFPREGINEPVVDTCGPGGMGRSYVNISTATALLSAACGVPTAKHGNRSVSSKSGSADVLQALGFRIDCPPETSARLLREHKFCFLLAPLYHPSMKHAAPVRREIKIRTIFNLAGPLSNPAFPTHQLLGVSHEPMMELMAETLRLLGRERALIVHGRAGHDEISLSQVTDAIHLRADGSKEKMVIDPKDFGAKGNHIRSLSITSSADSADKIRRVLEGEESAISDEVNINVGAVLWLTGKADSIKDGFEFARGVQRSGAGAKLLNVLVTESRKAD